MVSRTLCNYYSSGPEGLGLQDTELWSLALCPTSSCQPKRMAHKSVQTALLWTAMVPFHLHATHSVIFNRMKEDSNQTCWCLSMMFITICAHGEQSKCTHVHKLKQLVGLCVCPCVSCPNFGLSKMKSMTSKQINKKSEFYTLYITVHLSNIDTHACWTPLVINATIYKFILLVYFLVALYTSSQCPRACFK